MIKTWQQRCEEHPDHEGIVSNQMIMERMQEEIDELRQALAQPVDAVNMTQERVDETVKDEHEPVAWFIQYEDSHEFVWSKPDGWRVKQALEIQPLYTAPPKREWVGYTNEDRERIVPMLIQSLINHDEKTMAGLLNAILIDIEQQLKERNT